MTDYQGLVKLPYAEHPMHKFNATIQTTDGEKSEELYFCSETLSLKFIQVVGEETIYSIDGGLVETTFTDKDFSIYSTCQSGSRQFLKEVTMPAFKPLFF